MSELPPFFQIGPPPPEIESKPTTAGMNTAGGAPTTTTAIRTDRPTPKPPRPSPRQ